jgi:uncharacterized protein with HEPN domain
LPSDNPLRRLNDILENIDRIVRYTHGHGFEDFVRNHLARDAVERCLLRISEAAKKPDSLVDEMAPEQPWPEIRALGNVIRHEYDTLDARGIWTIIQNELPSLEASVQGMIRKLDDRP